MLQRRERRRSPRQSGSEGRFVRFRDYRSDVPGIGVDANRAPDLPRAPIGYDFAVGVSGGMDLQIIGLGRDDDIELNIVGHALDTSAMTS